MDPKQELLEALVESLAGTLTPEQRERATRALISCGDAMQKISDADDVYVVGLVSRLLLAPGAQVPP